MVEYSKERRDRRGKEEFLIKYRSAANFDAIVNALREKLQSPVISKDIDDLDQAPFGPVQPLLDLINFPEDKREGLVLAPSRNRRLPLDIQNQLLELNRSNLDYDEVIKLKRAIIDEYRDGKPL